MKLKFKNIIITIFVYYLNISIMKAHINAVDSQKNTVSGTGRIASKNLLRHTVN